MPPIIIVFAIYSMYQTLKLLDNHFGLILVYTAFNLPLSVWILANFLSQIPPSIEEAALVDGAGPFTILFRIVVPVMAPSLTATFFTLFCVCLERLFVRAYFNLFTMPNYANFDSFAAFSKRPTMVGHLGSFCFGCVTTCFYNDRIAKIFY